MKLVRLGVVFFATVLLIGIGGKAMKAPVIFADDGVKIDEKNFPDAIFREYVKEFDTRVQDGILDQEELDAVTSISCEAMSIQSMKGIEFFPKLTTIYCPLNMLKSLDISANTELTNLRCDRNQLTGLDVSKNTKLGTINCMYNSISSLDVSANTSLKYLFCSYNSLSGLDVSKNTSLLSLECGQNKITSLDVSKNTSLRALTCSDNLITSLDVTNNTSLTNLNCYSNKIPKLDVSKCTELQTLSCSGNLITSLNVENLAELQYFYCGENKLTSLDVSKNPDLLTFSCPQNKIASLDVSHNPKLMYLLCYSNRLTSLDLSANTKLKQLACTLNFLPTRPVVPDTCVISFEPQRLVDPVVSVKAEPVNGSSIRLTWDAVSGATGYQVWRATSATGTFISLGTVETNEKLSTGLNGGTKYFYKVRAYKKLTDEKDWGAFSPIVSAETFLAKPSGVKAVTESLTSIKVSWNAVTGAAGYQVWRSTQKDSGFVALGFVDTTSRVSTGLKTGTTYYYKVRAYKMVNGKKVYGDYSIVVSAVPKPATPSNVKAAVSSAKNVTVSWNAVAGATGYEVYRATSANGTYSRLGAVTTTSRVCPGLTTGTKYYFKVRAYVAINGVKYYSDYSSVVSATPKK